MSFSIILFNIGTFFYQHVFSILPFINSRKLYFNYVHNMTFTDIIRLIIFCQYGNCYSILILLSYNVTIKK